MTADSVYLAAYTAVSDEKIYDEQWVLIEECLASQGFDADVKKRTMEILGDVDEKIPLSDVWNSLSNANDEEKTESIALSLKISLQDNARRHRQRNCGHRN